MIKAILTIQFVIIIALLLVIGWGAVEYYRLDQDWARHAQQLTASHAEIKASLEERLESTAKDSRAEGYWKAFYNVCFGTYQNPIGCIQMARNGYQTGLHQETMPGWSWAYIKDTGLQIQ